MNVQHKSGDANRALILGQKDCERLDSYFCSLPDALQAEQPEIMTELRKLVFLVAYGEAELHEATS